MFTILHIVLCIIFLCYFLSWLCWQCLHQILNENGDIGHLYMLFIYLVGNWHCYPIKLEVDCGIRCLFIQVFMLLVDYFVKDLMIWTIYKEYRCNNEISVNFSTVKWFRALILFWVYDSHVAFHHRSIQKDNNGLGVFFHRF